MVYDTNRSVAILFGGSGNEGYLRDTWELRLHEATDADGDLVADDCDHCPGTDVGIQVDREGCLYGDFNRNGSVELSDFARFQDCFGLQPLDETCDLLGFDGDGAVDLTDHAVFVAALGN